VNDQPVADFSGMLNLIAAQPPGQEARIKVLRNGKAIEFKVKIGKRPRFEIPQQEEE